MRLFTFILTVLRRKFPRRSAVMTVTALIGLVLFCGCAHERSADLPRLYYNMGFSEGLGPVLVDGKWGFINPAGTLVIEPKYNHVGPFREGLARVRIGAEPKPRRGPSGLVGYIDTSGREIIRPQFVRAESFTEHRAVFMVWNEQHRRWKFGYLDQTGFWAIDPVFDRAMPFSEGLAAVQADGFWGYVDTAGRLVIEARFRAAHPFSDGLAAVVIGNEWGYIDRTGKIIIEPGYSVALPFRDGLAPVARGGVFGYIAKSGEVAIPSKFMAAQSFQEGLAAVQFFTRKWGFINTSGELVVAPRYDWVKGFSDGLAAVNLGAEWVSRGGVNQVVPKGLWGYIDKHGEIQIELRFNEASPFTDGFAQVNLTSYVAWLIPTRQRMAYIDRTGQIIWQEP